ncbi:MAG: hypothetical protein KatS3mg031_2367 [Chitinophagales bacterium]|nr:MAG: hypothetical protein KatS3mg031_2367 [Chitinophagales bacterium]
MYLRLALLGILLLFGQIILHAQDTLRVMYYNVLNYPGSTPQRATYFKEICSFVKPDVLLVGELTNDTGADMLLQAIDSVFPGAYSRAAFINGPDSDNMLFYNALKTGIVHQENIPTALRDHSYYKIFLKGDYLNYTDTVFLNLFVVHLRSSKGIQNENLRYDELLRLKAFYEALDEPVNILAGGDFNFYSYSEAGYQLLVDSLAEVPLFDPLQAGIWSNNPDFAALHTQSTRLAAFGGGATGGLDDRFDFIFHSADITSGANRLQLIPGSCRAIGNCGLHFNKAVIDPPVGVCVPENISQALYYMSDHLPVYAELLFSGKLATTLPEQRPRYCTSVMTEVKNKVLYIRVQGDSEYTYHIRIMDLTGRILLDTEGYTSISEIPLMGRGMFIISVITDDGALVFKQKIAVY